MLVRHAVTQSADRANESLHHLHLEVIGWIYRRPTMKENKVSLTVISTLTDIKKGFFRFLPI